MSSIATSTRRLGVAALLAATLVPAAATAAVPTAADRMNRPSATSDQLPLAADAGDRGLQSPTVLTAADAGDRRPAPPVAADARDRVPTSTPFAADAPDRVPTTLPLAADAPDRVPVAQVPADDDGVPVALPLGLFGLLAAAGLGVAVLRRTRHQQSVPAGPAQQH